VHTSWTPPSTLAPPSSTYGSLRGLDLALRGLLAATALVAVLAVVFRAREYSLLGDLRDGRFVAPADLEASDDRIATTGGLTIVLLVATGVVFVIWLWRATQNLRAFPNPPLRKSPGWAIGSWFVPVLNLWAPKQMVNDAWRGSGPHGAKPTWTSAPVPTVFTVWWVLLLASWAVGFVAGIPDTDTLDLDGLRAYSFALLVSEVLAAAAAACAIVVVVKISARQLAASTSVTATPGFSPDPPPPGSTLPPGV
jgi:hypothetical protein